MKTTWGNISRIFPAPVAFLAMAAVLLASCRQKDLIIPEAGMAVLDVRFAWPDTLAAKPEGMTLWFFSTVPDDPRIWRFDIAGPDGGPVELPYGEYTLIAANNDLPAIRISDTSSPDRLTASLNATDSIAPSIRPLYRALAENISFTPAGLRWTEDDIGSERHGKIPTLLSHPKKATTTYNIQVRDIKGFDRIQSAKLSFHGVCQDLLLYDALSEGRTLDYHATFGPFRNDGTLCTSFESFGPLPITEEATATITVTLSTRRTYQKTFHIGEQIANRRDKLLVDIIITGLTVPDDGPPPDDDVGMEVGVDGWITVNIDYITGP